jgi:signal transduction histidine kinase
VWVSVYLPGLSSASDGREYLARPSQKPKESYSLTRNHNDASSFLLLRYVLIIAASYLFLFEGQIAAPAPVVILIAGALLSNVLLSQVSENLLLRPVNLGAVIISDIAWISLGLWYKGNFGNDIFFIYFFVLFLAAAGQNLGVIVSASVLLSAVDLLFVIPGEEGKSIWTSPSLVRVPFMFMAALFYGYLSDQVRQEKRLTEKRLHALRDIDDAITSTLDLRAVLNVLLDKIDLFLPYAVTTIRLLNGKTGELVPVACRNVDEEEWKAATAGRGGVERMLPDHRAPVIVHNAQSDHRSLASEFLRKNSLVSYLRVPLVAKDQLLGVLTFFTKEEHEFSPNEVEFLSTLAAQAAIAIHNSQLYAEMKSLADELSASNRVKDEFLSVMSHELRTPLNVIQGYTGMLKDKMMGELTQDQEKALAKILTESRGLLSMIDSVLYATSIGTRSAKVENRELSLTSFLDDVRSNYDVLVNKDLILRWEYPSELPVVKTDADKLRRILINLINNAIKFTDRGQVTVTTHYYPEAKAVEFRVIDTGIGIPDELLSMIFDKFYQVDSSDRRLYGGVGIGLYIVKTYTELLGARVEVKSKVGEGSVFTITLPTEVPYRNSFKSAPSASAVNEKENHHR